MFNILKKVDFKIICPKDDNALKHHVQLIRKFGGQILHAYTDEIIDKKDNSNVLDVYALECRTNGLIYSIINKFGKYYIIKNYQNKGYDLLIK